MSEKMKLSETEKETEMAITEDNQWPSAMIDVK